LDEIHVIRSKIAQLKSDPIVVTLLPHPRAKYTKFKVGANNIGIIIAPNPVI